MKTKTRAELPYLNIFVPEELQRTELAARRLQQYIRPGWIGKPESWEAIGVEERKYWRELATLARERVDLTAKELAECG